MDTERFSKIRTLFDRALELPENERESFLRQACQNQEDVLNEVLELLRAHNPEKHFLSRPIAISATAFESSPLAPSPRIGPYKLERLLGRGGMGEVWQAVRDDGTFSKTVAIKIMLIHLDNERLIERFLQERQLLASLDHPNIARILDGGRLEDGRPYTVMEYVEGLPIDRYCDERRVDLGGRISLFIQVCNSVEYLHKNGVIHRDLKPGNILVSTSGSVRLLDFGIARITGVRKAANLTAPQDLMLTPGYASPEQLAGEPCTDASDVFSLGIILYQLLTGRLPSIVAPKAPSTATQYEFQQIPGETQIPRKQLEGDLDFIVLKSMEHNLALRYGSAQALAEELRRFLSGMPLKSRSYPLPERVRRFIFRHRAAAAVFAVILILVAFASWQGIQNWKSKILADSAQRQLSQVLDKLPATTARNDLPQEVMAQLVNEVRQLRNAMEGLLNQANLSNAGLRARRDFLLKRATSFLDQTAPAAKQSGALALEVGRAYKTAADLESSNAAESAGRSQALGHYAKANYFLASARDNGVADPVLQENIKGIERRVNELGGRLDELTAEVQKQFTVSPSAISTDTPVNQESQAVSSQKSPLAAAKKDNTATPRPPAEKEHTSLSQIEWQELQAASASKIQMALQASQKMQEDLASRNLTLNSDTLYASKQIQMCKDMAEHHAKLGNWNEAKEYLTRADAYADRVLRALGH
jgi:eukaryotic-like serine/threonine-protein kinase